MSKARFEIRHGGLVVAAVEGPMDSALNEAEGYYFQYAFDATEDEPVELVYVYTFRTTEV